MGRVERIKLSGIREILDYAKEFKDVIALNFGEPDFPTPKKICEAAKRAIDEGYINTMM
ncbi:Putative N-acetyl-LL-diaminopimelate aminotransferase [archaeon HR06]|nr:Putative N-acetyl-LL-diaminopimelate aminotransferase [archaeon HR06]